MDGGGDDGAGGGREGGEGRFIRHLILLARVNGKGSAAQQRFCALSFFSLSGQIQNGETLFQYIYIYIYFLYIYINASFKADQYVAAVRAHF